MATTKKRYTAEQIVNKLRQADVELSKGATIALACKAIGVTEQTYYRWRREYGGLKVSQAKRLKDLFLDKRKLLRVFGEDLWEKRETRIRIRHLMTSRVKPWECVGTREECKLAARLHFERFGERQFTERPFMDELRNAYRDLDLESAKQKYLVGLQDQHNIPDHKMKTFVEKYRNIVH